MNEHRRNHVVKLFVLITFIIMISVNALANILPINGQLTAQVSDTYPNLITPIPLTFSIWGVIYILLMAFVLYLIGFFNDKNVQIDDELRNKVGLIFGVSSVINALWIFAWHYNQIFISVILMISLLSCLGFLNSILFNAHLSNKEGYFLKMPISVYFGWITIATIANITAYLVSLNWSGFGLSAEFWAVAAIIASMLIGIITIIIYNDISYGLVLIWAYIGIIFRHSSRAYLNMQYPSIVMITIVCIVFVAITEIYIFFANHKKTI